MSTFLKCLLVSVCVMQGILSFEPYCQIKFTFANAGVADSKVTINGKASQSVCLFCVKITTELTCYKSDTHIMDTGRISHISLGSGYSTGGYFKAGSCPMSGSDKLFPENMSSLKPTFVTSNSRADKVKSANFKATVNPTTASPSISGNFLVPDASATKKYTITPVMSSTSDGVDVGTYPKSNPCSTYKWAQNGNADWVWQDNKVTGKNIVLALEFTEPGRRANRILV